MANVRKSNVINNDKTESETARTGKTHCAGLFCLLSLQSSALPMTFLQDAFKIFSAVQNVCVDFLDNSVNNLIS